MSLNKVLLLGRLGQSVELKYTPSGKAVANFSVATSESWKGKDGKQNQKTEWHRIVVWDKQAENCAQYLEKGSQVYLEGRLETRSWEGKDGVKKYTTEIIASNVQFLSRSEQKDKSQDQFSGPDEENPSNYGANNYHGTTQANKAQPASARDASFRVDAGPAFTSDDIPF